MMKKERQYMLILVVLLYVLLAFYYYVYFVPLQKEKEQLTKELQEKRAQVQTIGKKSGTQDAGIQQEKLKDAAELIPVKPYTDQLLLDFAKLQALSRAEIKGVQFSGEQEVNVKDLPGKFIPKETGEDNKGNAEEQMIVAAAKQGNEKNPEGMNKKIEVDIESIRKKLPEDKIQTVEITVNIEGKYKEIYNFVTEAQALSRYLRIDQLSFNTTEKDRFEIPKKQDMSATVKLTSYYAPQYASLLDKLSPVNVEPPSGKWDPTQYPVIKKEDAQKEDMQTEPPSAP